MPTRKQRVRRMNPRIQTSYALTVQCHLPSSINAISFVAPCFPYVIVVLCAGHVLPPPIRALVLSMCIILVM